MKTNNVPPYSTSYKANEEGGKFIVEGSGSVKVKDETRTATFKFMRQQLEQEKNGEQGIEVSVTLFTMLTVGGY